MYVYVYECYTRRRTWNKLHEHEDLVGVVVGLEQLKNERTGGTLEQEILLSHDVALLCDGYG